MDVNIRRILQTLPTGSWCTQAKAIRLAEIVHELRPSVAVEIGVFGGDTLLVIAQAMRQVGRGMVHGIDPWDAQVAIEGVPEGVNRDWWSKMDMEGVMKGCELKVRVMACANHVKLHRSRSDNLELISSFANESIGLFHLDGNHGEDSCLNDCRNWLPKLANGAILFFDDVSWFEGGKFTTELGLRWLCDNGCEIAEPMVGDCAILRRI